jgi:hypothetical protein
VFRLKPPNEWGRRGAFALILGAAVLTAAVPAAADSKAEAAEAARGANCTPAKTTVVRYVPGAEGETVYKLTCTENKNAFVIVRCRGRVCAVLRSPTEFSIH